MSLYIRQQLRMMIAKTYKERRSYMTKKLSNLNKANGYRQFNRWKLIIPFLIFGILLISILFNNSASLGFEDLVLEEVNELEETVDSTIIDQAEVMGDATEEDYQLEVIYVDVKGAVNEPNMYSFTRGSRVYDAIMAAGGLTTHAASDMVNQAMLLEDQMMLYIHSKDEVEAMTEHQPTELMTSLFVSSSNDTDYASELVNINSADLEGLMTLPNIGPKKAEAIINYRQDFGSFKIIEDIMNVSGIGQKTFDNLKDYIIVTE